MQNKPNNNLYVIFRGGLGNQLFILATAFVIAQKYSLKMVIEPNLGFLRDVYQRKYELDEILDGAFKKTSIIEKLKIGLYFKFPKIANKLFGNSNIISDENIMYISSYDNYTNIYFGLGQDEGFIQNYKQEIRDILLSKASNNINYEDSVVKIAIHGRIARNTDNNGDVISTASPNELEISYYEKAIKQIVKKYPKAVFYIFSDNVGLFLEYLQIDNKYKRFLKTGNNNQNKAYQDFIEMLSCDHFIIANSTFSWWAAYLGERESSLVICPHVTFWDSSKIIPQHWIQI
ncbi:MAG: alpha-1,2-fucosyltransferase [Saprospiraceae bacterium]|jgi:hypothetical protein|nr:alpha-1,2-fucosyltransferase [Saprospiraceae bacterium]